MNLFINYRDFYETFQKNNTILDVYNHLEYIPANGKGVVLDNSLAPKINSKKTISVSLFPSYLEPTFFDTATKNIVKISQKIIGYSILLYETRDVNLFLKNQYKKNFNRSINRYVSRF